jgi:hypothetical protein
MIPATHDLNQMHSHYRNGGAARGSAPQVIYADTHCPHPGCEERLQGIDFRLEAYGSPVHDPLVKAWWDDTGLAGRCPRCGSWIHFTIRGKRVITPAEAAQLPQLPDDWHANATIL